MGTRGPFPGGKVWLGRDADHSPSSAEVKYEYELYLFSKACSGPALLLYYLQLWCHVMISLYVLKKHVFSPSNQIRDREMEDEKLEREEGVTAWMKTIIQLFQLILWWLGVKCLRSGQL
jgi:hypothetical protein